MKQPEQPVKKPSLALWLLIISLIVMLAGAGGTVAFANMSKTIKMTSGKIVDTFTKKEFASRKQTIDREYEVVRYTVEGKDFTKKVAMPRAGYSSQYVTVYYYEKYPGYAWFFKKSNTSVFFCALIAGLAAAAAAFSAFRMVKGGPAPVLAQKQLVGKKGASK
jgi:hypothetical protein